MTRPRARGLPRTSIVVAVLTLLVPLVLLVTEPAAAADISMDLFGTAAGGWSTSSGTETNPGPTVIVDQADHVTIQLTSEDIPNDHTFWIDYNANGVVDSGEPNSPIFTTTIAYVFDALVPGTFTYYCGIHSIPGSPGSPMRGTWTTRPPTTIAIASPVAGTSWSGGVAHDIVFDLSDVGGPGGLTVWVNYSHSGGAVRGVVAGPIPGQTNPNVVAWTPPVVDATDVVINITVRNSVGATSYQESDPFEVDSARPTIQAIAPANDTVGVGLNAPVRVTWSEGMNRSATEAPSAFSVSRVVDGASVSGSHSWSSDLRTMTFMPASAFVPFASYRVRINATAKDDSDPGNAFGTSLSIDFTTGAAPDTSPPVIAPAIVNPDPQVPGGFVNITVEVSDDTAIADVFVRIVGPSLSVNVTMARSAGLTWYFNRSYELEGAYVFTIWAMDTSGNVASSSGTLSIAAIPGPPSTPTGSLLLWIALGIAAVGTVAVLAFLLARRRRSR